MSKSAGGSGMGILLDRLEEYCCESSIGYRYTAYDDHYESRLVHPSIF